MLSAGQFKFYRLHKALFPQQFPSGTELIYPQRLAFGQDTDQGPFLEPSSALCQSVPGDINAGETKCSLGTKCDPQKPFLGGP